MMNLLQRKIKYLLKCCHALPSINLHGVVVNYNDIHTAFNVSKKKENDKNNKLRESIICSIINDEIPPSYFAVSFAWSRLKLSIMNYFKELCGKFGIQELRNISCVHKGGRKFNYDFDVLMNDTHTIKIELKFNASDVSGTPQFSSPTKPSRYFSENYEEFYYDSYFSRLASEEIQIPDKDTYLKCVHSSNPACEHMMKIKELYKIGCTERKKLTSDDTTQLAIKIYQLCNSWSKCSIEDFVKRNDLDYEMLSDYLINSQKDKIYMMFKDGHFYSERLDVSSYKIKSVTKNKNSYVAVTQNGTILNILLRWKNGNGVCFPAFQISMKKTKKTKKLNDELTN